MFDYKSLSRSEIVVPVFRDGKVVAVLDIDSINLNAFDETDRESLEKITGLIQNVFIIFRS